MILIQLVQNDTHIRKNQTVVENKGKLEVKNYPKSKQPFIQQPKLKPPNCPTCKQKNWLEFDKGYHCRNCENIINKQKHQIGKKDLRQDRDFSGWLNYAKKDKRNLDEYG